jgi:hypothetical protein
MAGSMTISTSDVMQIAYPGSPWTKAEMGRCA